MSAKSWHTGLEPKVRGTWNLHNALRHREKHLDFFLMTSSSSGSVGTATKSNYCAANAFLDAFARHRRSLGLKATALGIGAVSEVGYLHEHPDVQSMLLRKGLHPITENELLRIIDIALSNQDTTELRSGVDHFVEGHILTGMEPQGLRKQREQGFEGDNSVLHDPRCAVIYSELTNGANASDDGGSKDPGGGSLPKAVAEALVAQQTDGIETSHDAALSNAVQDVMARKLCHLLLLQPNQLNPQVQLGNFGMDSMLAAEFRTFIFHALEVDIPFQMLLEKGATIANLTDMVIADMLSTRE
jgi:hypothetical protein